VDGAPAVVRRLLADVNVVYPRNIAYHRRQNPGRRETANGENADHLLHSRRQHETTIMRVFDALIIHGMIVLGDPSTDRYDPVVIGVPDDRAPGNALPYDERLNRLTLPLAGTPAGE